MRQWENTIISLLGENNSIETETSKQDKIITTIYLGYVWENGAPCSSHHFDSSQLQVLDALPLILCKTIFKIALVMH